MSARIAIEIDPVTLVELIAKREIVIAENPGMFGLNRQSIVLRLVDAKPEPDFTDALVAALNDRRAKLKAGS